MDRTNETTPATTEPQLDPAKVAAAKLGAAQESLRVALDHALGRAVTILQREAGRRWSVEAMLEVAQAVGDTHELAKAWLNLSVVPAPTTQGTLFAEAAPATASRPIPTRKTTPNTPRGRKPVEVQASTKEVREPRAAYKATAPKLAKLKKRGTAPVLPGELLDAFVAGVKAVRRKVPDNTLGALKWRARTGQKLPGDVAAVLESVLKRGAK